MDGKALRLLWVMLHIFRALSPREGLRLLGAALENLFRSTHAALNKEGPLAGSWVLTGEGTWVLSLFFSSHTLCWPLSQAGASCTPTVSHRRTQDSRQLSFRRKCSGPVSPALLCALDKV